MSHEGALALTEIDALTEFLDIARDFPMEVLLIGTMARRFGFDLPRNLAPSRTQDWDFALRLSDWAAYTTFLERLQAAGYRVNEGRGTAIHRSGVIFDLIPCGQVQVDGQIRHPDNPRSAMDARVYDEAWGQPINCEPHPGLRLCLADPCAWAAIKLIAWEERGDNKHVRDVLHVMQHFDTTDGEAMWEASPEPDWSQIQASDASPWLFGRAIAARLSPALCQRLVACLTQIQGGPWLGEAARALRGRPPTDADVEKLEAAVRACINGIESAAPLPAQ